MSAPKHNADWRWERKGCRIYSSEFRRGRPLKVAEVAFGELDEAGLEARGRLIAAAPDLLEAAQKALEANDRIVDRMMAATNAAEAARISQEGADEFTATLPALREAIAKASGADA